MGQKKLGFGFMRLPLTDPDNPVSLDKEQLNRMVDTFLERGFTYFDTAYMYHEGQSEVFLREALVKRYPRDRFTVADKLPTMFLEKKGDQERIFPEQLEKCGVTYFDYYLLHCLNQDTYAKVQKFDSFSFVQRLKEEGKVKKIGFSFHDTAELLDEILTAHPEVDFVQLQLNYLDWEDEGVQSRKCYETARRHGKSIIVMEPVKGGTLANVPKQAQQLFQKMQPELSVASWAVRYITGQEGISMVLSGMSDLEQVLDNTSYMSDFVPMTEEEYGVIEKVVDIIHESEKVPCTSCQYCVEGCPQNIPIPKYFTLLNQKMLEKDGEVQRKEYISLAKNHGKASACIQCRECEKICPQHIVITEYLKKVSEALE